MQHLPGDAEFARAVSATVRLSAGSTSSRRIAAEWTGFISGGCLAEYSGIAGFSALWEGQSPNLLFICRPAIELTVGFPARHHS